MREIKSTNVPNAVSNRNDLSYKHSMSSEVIINSSAGTLFVLMAGLPIVT